MTQVHRSDSPCGVVPPTPGWAPCTRAKGHSGPCAHAVSPRVDNGLVNGWQAMHEQKTHVQIMPNPSGPMHPATEAIGVTYPTGIVEFSHHEPGARGHSVNVALHFDDNGVQLYAWVDSSGERHADLIVEMRQDYLHVERATEIQP